MSSIHCCELMDGYLREGDVAIRYSAVVREYTIPVLDGINGGVGESGIGLRFCPWCGKRFPEGLRDMWFDSLTELGFDPGPIAVIPRFPNNFVRTSGGKARNSDG